MRSGKIVEWMTLTTNLYLLSRDKELRASMKKISTHFLEKLKDVFTNENETEVNESKPKTEVITDVFSGDELKRIVKYIYSKLRIASAAEMKQLEQQLMVLRKELALVEARIVAMENNRKHHGL